MGVHVLLGYAYVVVHVPVFWQTESQRLELMI